METCGFHSPKFHGVYTWSGSGRRLEGGTDLHVTQQAAHKLLPRSPGGLLSPCGRQQAVLPGRRIVWARCLGWGSAEGLHRWSPLCCPINNAEKRPWVPISHPGPQVHTPVSGLRTWGRLKAGGEGVAEDEMVGWHHRPNGLESEQTPGDREGQGSLACCRPWGLRESDKSDRTK